jgi:hypothetical protein
MSIESQKRYRTFLFLLLYIILIISGISIGMSPDGSPEGRIGLLFSLIIALILTQICIVDSKIAGKPLSIFTYWVIFIFYGIAVPICVIRARGLSGLKYLLIHIVCMFIMLFISIVVTRLVCGTF